MLPSNMALDNVENLEEIIPIATFLKSECRGSSVRSFGR
jgi:hypothetical protein